MNIGIFTHKEADYDALCSVITMTDYLKNRYPNTKIYPIIDTNSTNITPKYDFKLYKKEEVKCNLDYAIILDVLEIDRIYGLELINNVKVKNRYVIDHHESNRKPLEILDDNNYSDYNAAATCQILAKHLIENNYLTEERSYNLFIGMASDTNNFTRCTTEETKEIIKYLNLDSKVMEDICNKLTALTPKQQELLNDIKILDNGNGLSLYLLKKDENFIHEINLLKHPIIESFIAPIDNDEVSCLIIDCKSQIKLKLQKKKDSSFNLLEFATEYCNGGGHDVRCGGKFSKKDYPKEDNFLEFIISKIKEDYKRIKKGRIKKL